MEKVELSALTKEELIELAKALQLRLEAAEKEKQELKELAEIGKKYKEHLQAEVVRLIRLVEGDNSPLIRLVEKADIDTLKELVQTYEQKAKEKFKASAVATVQEEEEQKLSPEWLMKASYAELVKLSEKLEKEVKQHASERQTHPELFPLYYERKLLGYVKENLVALKFGQRFKLPTEGSKTAVFYKSSPLPSATTPLTDQPTPPLPEAHMIIPISVEAVCVEVQEYGGYIDLHDFVEIKSFVPLADYTTDILGDDARITLDTIAMVELTLGTNVLYAGGVNARSQLTGEQKLTKMDIRKAVNLLKRGNIPPFEDGYYVCLIHPDKLLDLFTDQELIMLSAYNTSTSEKGIVGRFAGVKFYVTTTLPTVVGGNDSTVYQTLVIGKYAYGIVDLDSTTLKMRYENCDYYGRVKRIGWVARFAVKRLDEKAIVRIESN